jgi:hypothetical protein
VLWKFLRNFLEGASIKKFHQAILMEKIKSIPNLDQVEKIDQVEILMSIGEGTFKTLTLFTGNYR